MAEPFLNGKGKVDPSVLTTDQANATISNISTQQTQTIQQDEVNIWVAAQRGEVDVIKQLIESGKATASDRDPQNITPLHWAAINAQLAACKYLLEQGAEVDALGGDLVATPMQWAARNGYLYIIHLLVSHNADPTITDSQGYNTLHLVTHSSAVMPLLYMLHQPIAIDHPDSQGHTALMWAAYQGDAISVELLLKHGASATARDQAGLTPLHWAVVRGNKICIRHLIEAGADTNAKDDSGKTPRDMAVELKSLGAWKRAFEEAGLLEDGRKQGKPLSDRNTKIAIFALPTFFFFLIFTTLSSLPWFTGVPLALGEFFGMHHIVTRVLLNHRNYTDSVTHSPYFAGIILASIFWVGQVWVTYLLQATPEYSFTHLGFAICIGICSYNFIRAIALDPGTCPKPVNDSELKAIIEDLTSQGRFNGQTFCIQCMARKSLRSKHCRVCDRCTARFDHHCPWVWNCVGVNNHRQFLMFVLTLVLGICLYIRLTYAYFANKFTNGIPPNPNCGFPDTLCAITSTSAYTHVFAVGAWAALQLSWTILLLASQLWQVARQLTTLEVSNLGRYGFMGGRGGSSLATQQGHAHHHGGGDENGGADGGHAHAHGPNHAHGKCGGCGSGFFMQILGFDRFTKGKAADGLARASKASNPFDQGWIANCTDFWTAGRELGVEYDKLYDVPVGGFMEAKRRNRREEMGSDSGMSVGAKRSAFSRLLSGRGSRGYQPLSMSEEV
jgi:palmitoyltransferase